MMKFNIHRKPMRASVYLFLLATAFIVFYLGSSAQAAYNYDHVNVTTKVNITNSYPEILNMSVDGEINNITLSAGMAKTVYCNATIRDWNGYNDINLTNATLYYYLNSSGQTDDNNEHYTNGSCVESANDGQYIANYSCSFPVQYYAYNGSWACNVTVMDNNNFTDADNRTIGIDALYAINVTDVIDYGNLSVTETSDNITANITNFGNMNINVSVLGYGLTEGDGIGLICALGSNISVENERYYASEVPWSSKIQLSGSNADINLTLPNRVDDTSEIVNSTYWQLYVPPNPFGYCNGTVRFTATVP